MVKKLPKTLLITGLAFLAVHLIWGAAGPIIKFTIDYIPPFTFLFLRFLIVCVILLPYVIVKLLGTKIPKKDYLNFFLLGVFSQTAIALVFVALKYTTSLDATIISVVTGALTIYAGHHFYKEEVSKKVKIGVALTCVGTFFVVLEPLFTGNHQGVPMFERIIGNLLALIYNLTWVVYVIWSKMSMGENSTMLKKTLSFMHLKPMTKKYSPVLISAITMYVGLITLVPLALLENSGYFGGVTDFNVMAIEPKGIFGLLYMAIFSSIVAYFLNQWALERGKITDSVIMSYLGPVFSFPVAFFLLGELPTKFLLIGASIIVVGVITAESAKK